MKTLIIVRHAHRDTSQGRELDNGLSATGKKQTKKFTKFYLKNFGRMKPMILSSPSKRCVQTVKPLATKLKVPIKRTLSLFEEGDEEKGFKTRVSKFCKKARKSKSETVILCSHGDWIPIALKLLTGKARELKKGEWVVL